MHKIDGAAVDTVPALHQPLQIFRYFLEITFLLWIKLLLNYKVRIGKYEH